MGPTGSSSPITKDDWARPLLAIGLTVVSVGAVVVLGVVIILKDGGKAEHVLSISLPLLGTWVGTVLAYYFSRENFESASRSVAAMAKALTTSEKLASLKVVDRMIRNDPQTLFSRKEPTSGINLKQLLADMEAAKKGSRVPVFDSAGKVIRLVLHRSLIERFLSDRALAGTPQGQLATLTLDDLLTVAALKNMAQGFAIVGDNDTLADAKKAMEDKKGDGCQDVFVTRGGKPTDEVIGWITNVIITNESTV